MRKSVLFAVAAIAPALAAAQADDIERGRAFVDSHCARCHATGPTGASPHKDAPAFRTLHRKYPVESLAEALAEGVITGHPDMPVFALAPEEIGEIIAYLKSLEI
jgi:mono/diheme cytochrome c family protein